MARPLRLEWAGGRHHISARGNERGTIFRDEGDRLHFLELLGELPAQFGTRLHAYVLMDNHYHAMIETPETNLSRTVQWLNGSYTMWFNVRHRRAGHLLQGRFKSVLIEEDRDWQRVARYLHLNPVRVGALGMGKADRSAQQTGFSKRPTAELVAQRIRRLRAYRWSSYRAYAGYETAPEWLDTGLLGTLCGGRSRAEQQAALREYTEQAVREGLASSPWEDLVGGVVLGSKAFSQEVSAQARRDLVEQPASRKLIGRVSWEEIVAAVEAEHGGRWEAFRDRYGDWGRDAALWLGRTRGRQRLAELAARVGGVGYAAVGAVLNRVRERLRTDAGFRARVHRLEARLSKLEI